MIKGPELLIPIAMSPITILLRIIITEVQWFGFVALEIGPQPHFIKTILKLIDLAVDPEKVIEDNLVIAQSVEILYLLDSDLIGCFDFDLKLLIDISNGLVIKFKLDLHFINYSCFNH